MAHRADDIPQGIKDTRQDIADTRSAMTEKLEILEERVREAVEGAQSSVEDIAGNVKETVDATVEAMRQTVEGAQSSVEDIAGNVKRTIEDTVATVKRTFDLPYQVEQHPWLMLGGSLLVGYMLGSRGGGRTVSTVSTSDTPSSAASTTADMSAYYSKPGSPASYSESPARPQSQQGMVSGARDRFKDEIALLKGAAVGAVISTLRDIVKQVLLPPAPSITSALTKLGGQPSDRPAQNLAPISRSAGNGGAIL